MVAREEEETLHNRGSVTSRSRIKRKDGMFDPFLATVPEGHFCFFFFFSAKSRKSTRVRVRLRRHARQMGRLGSFEVSTGANLGSFIAQDARENWRRGRRGFAANGDRLDKETETERPKRVVLIQWCSKRRSSSSSSFRMRFRHLITSAACTDTRKQTFPNRNPLPEVSCKDLHYCHILLNLLERLGRGSDDSDRHVLFWDKLA